MYTNRHRQQKQIKVLRCYMLKYLCTSSLHLAYSVVLRAFCSMLPLSFWVLCRYIDKYQTVTNTKTTKTEYETVPSIVKDNGNEQNQYHNANGPWTKQNREHKSEVWIFEYNNMMTPVELLRYPHIPEKRASMWTISSGDEVSIIGTSSSNISRAARQIHHRLGKSECCGSKQYPRVVKLWSRSCIICRVFDLKLRCFIVQRQDDGFLD